MILYQDTSSIVKRYVRDERGVQETREAVQQADFLATSLIAYAEVRAAFARAKREGRFVNQDEYLRILRDFGNDWRHYTKVNLSSSLIRLAGDLAERHTIRGYDAVHLASAIVLRERIPEPVIMSTWDDQLWRTATEEGFAVAHQG